MLVPIAFDCPICGELIESAADPSQGPVQTYVEDCQVCCRPLVLTVRIEGQRAEVDTTPEGS